ncbi:MAG: (4Fe-4S)-binding protein [Deltaproteobacteria bacterium HGW-Deltaproteobacteria-6]|nr:MAG: (4Fe-4S)-binding protein [Deltaproteobacteria bacterium HGW-Deltaproteobacteria-6]
MSASTDDKTINNAKRSYTNGEVTIIWDAQKCQHSGNCIKHNPAVFRPKERPWVKPLNSTTEEIIKTVEKCPSGALTCFLNSDP